MSRIRTLTQSGLSIVEVMAISIKQGVQPLQYRGRPMWHFNREDDATRCGRKGPDSTTALVKILSGLYEGEKEEFIRIKPRDGFSMYNPPSWVSFHTATLLHSFPESFFININLSIYNRNGGKLPGRSTAPHHSPRTTTGPLTPDSKRIWIYSWSSWKGSFTRRAVTEPKCPSLLTIPAFSLHRM